MDIHLTSGLFGKKIKTIAKGVANYDNVMCVIDTWKESNVDNYKVEPYTQITLTDKCIAIDFGDYNTFMLIDKISKDEWKDINTRLNINS